MSCALTQGYTYTACKGGAGGISEVLITEIANITATALTTGVFTTITMASTKQFRRYILAKQMGSADDVMTYTDESGVISYEHQVDFSIKGLTNALKAEIKLIAQNTLVIIVKDRSGNYWAYGMGAVLADSKGMDFVTAGSPLGKALTDFNGFNLSFRGMETDYAHQVSSGIITALLSPA